MHITAIIPARLNSTRLKHKLLIEVEEKSIIQHVYERVIQADVFDRVCIAVDSKKLLKHCQKFGAEVFLTSKDHKSGTDRIAELARKIKTDIIVNVQGDEPLVSKVHLANLRQLIKRKEVDIATLCKPFECNNSLSDPSNVKVVFDNQQKALYFSRSVIPYPMHDAQFENHFHHIGLYAFKRKALLQISRLRQSNLERVELLEQLRWLQNGHEIHVAIVAGKSISIDTATDLKEFKKILKKRRIERKW